MTPADEYTYTSVITGVSSSATNSPPGYGVGATIPVQVTFSDAVNVNVTGGTPTLTLNYRRHCDLRERLRHDDPHLQLRRRHGENAADLDYTSNAALTLNGATIQVVAGGIDAALKLPTPAAPARSARTRPSRSTRSPRSPA